MTDELFKVLFAVGSGSATIAIGTVAFFLKKWSADLEEKDNALGRRIGNVEQELSDYKLEVNKEYVSKDEFLRVVSQHDLKLDKILDKISEMGERIGKHNE